MHLNHDDYEHVFGCFGMYRTSFFPQFHNADDVRHTDRLRYPHSVINENT